MSRKEFEAFIARQEELVSSDETPVDWEKQKDEWLDFIDELYNKIENYLKDYMNSRVISVEFDEFNIREEYIGQYQVRRMTIKVGKNTVVLKPIGTMLIGTKGRVDMVGPKGTVRLMLAEKSSNGPNISITVFDPKNPQVENKREHRQPDWEWKLVPRTPPFRYFKLDAELFLDSLMTLCDG